MLLLKLKFWPNLTPSFFSQIGPCIYMVFWLPRLGLILSCLASAMLPGPRENCLTHITEFSWLDFILEFSLDSEFVPFVLSGGNCLYYPMVWTALVTGHAANILSKLTWRSLATSVNEWMNESINQLICDSSCAVYNIYICSILDMLICHKWILTSRGLCETDAHLLINRLELQKCKHQKND